MARAFVHLSDIFGDYRDELGVRRAFWSLVEAYREPDEYVIIIEASPTRAKETSKTWAQEQGLNVLPVDETNWRTLGLRIVDVDCTGADPARLEQLNRELLRQGFVRGGRPWGEAGSSRRYVQPRGYADRLKALGAQARILAGECIVKIRDAWPDPDLRSRLGDRARARFSRKFTAADLLFDRLDESQAARPILVNAISHDGGRGPWHEWRASVAINEQPSELANECFDQHGVWPISFSYPGRPLGINPNPIKRIADIVPGFPYSFEDATEYMSTYGQAYLGLTQRKAGWDCFRHVEIMAAGCVPLMPDAVTIPDFAMVHYPKLAMAEVVTRVRNEGGVPNPATRYAFREHFRRHLTSESMARYALSAAGLTDSQRVLFIDAALPLAADYQSVLTLIGLKQIFGSECHVQHPVDYVYCDVQGDLSHLYGRGFGYTRLLDPGSKSSTEHGKPSLALANFDALIVGSISRNLPTAARLLQKFPPERTIWIHGEDTPPGLQQTGYLRKSGTHTFIRSIHSKRR